MSYFFSKLPFEKLLISAICLLTLSLIGLSVYLFLPHIKYPFKIQNKAQAKDYPELKVIENKKFNSPQQILEYFKFIAEKKGADYAFEVLAKAELPQNTDFHLIAHELGQTLYNQQGINGITVCDNNFGNGCSHSIVINEFVKYGPESIKTINETCKKAPGGGISYVMCFHGVGHGVLGYTEYDLPKAIDLCRRFRERNKSITEYRECSGGVVMEMIFGLHDQRLWSAKKDKYLANNNPLFLCQNSDVPTDVKDICYIYLTPFFYHLLEAQMTTTDDTVHKKALSFCDAIPFIEKENRISCYGGFGKEFIPIAYGKDLRNLDKLTNAQLKQAYHWCTLANEEDGIKSCVEQAALASYWGGRFPQNPARFCKAIDEKALQEDCLKYIDKNRMHG